MHARLPISKSYQSYVAFSPLRISFPNDYSFCQVDIKLTDAKSTQSEIQTLGQQKKNTNFISNGIILGGVPQGLLNILLGLGLPAQPLAVVIVTPPAHGHQSHHQDKKKATFLAGSRLSKTESKVYGWPIFQSTTHNLQPENYSSSRRNKDHESDWRH